MTARGTPHFTDQRLSNKPRKINSSTIGTIIIIIPKLTKLAMPTIDPVGHMIMNESSISQKSTKLGNKYDKGKKINQIPPIEIEANGIAQSVLNKISVFWGIFPTKRVISILTRDTRRIINQVINPYHNKQKPISTQYFSTDKSDPNETKSIPIEIRVKKTTARIFRSPTDKSERIFDDCNHI